MAITTGIRIGPYEIGAPIGAGGMGEVYRARDTKLNRDVAIKVLPESLADDRERLARFSREAQVLAALNHPNIAHIHGFEDSTGVPALVMELVEGPTLADRIAKGPLSIDEALPIAKQIAEALEAAHEHGIIHRDLKPANVKVRPDGTVKVLDFGLAKAVEPTPVTGANVTASPTITSPALTKMGVILGTAAYMSPEQAKGRAADKRSDVWAFGCVLFEMLAGRRAFSGDDMGDVLAAVVRAEPDWSALDAAAVLPTLRRLLRRCLQKDPRERYQDVGDLRLDLRDAAVSPDATPAGAGVPPRPSSTRLIAASAAAALVLSALAAAVTWRYAARSEPRAAVRFNIFPPDGTSFATVRVPSGVISPDGRQLVFAVADTGGRLQLWLRALDSLTTQPLAGTEGGDFPFWSPDSRWIAYFARDRLLKIPASGGPAQTLCDAPQGVGGAWNRDDVIVFGTSGGSLQRVAAAGGRPVPLTHYQAGQPDHRYPSFTPDGQHVLFLGGGPGGGGPDGYGIYLASLDSGESKRLTAADSSAIAVPEGFLLSIRRGTLFAQRFDLTKLALEGDPFPVVEGVNLGGFSGLPFSVSSTGALAYVYSPGAADPAQQLAWFDRQGKVLGTFGTAANYRGVDLSPDGKRVVAHRHDAQGGDLWMYDLARGTEERFTFDPSQDNSSPVWAPDGKDIAFASQRSGKWGIYRKPSTLRGEETALLTSEVNVSPSTWSPDGGSIVYSLASRTTTSDLWQLPLVGRGQATPILQRPEFETNGQISPDGRWLAYDSNENQQPQIYVMPFPTGTGRWQVSTNGGRWPRWRQDGRELFYVEGLDPNTLKLMAADVTTTTQSFERGTPRELFDTGFIAPRGRISGHSYAQYYWYAVTPDGQRFLIPRPVDAERERPGLASSNPIVVVLNWSDELKARVPTK